MSSIQALPISQVRTQLPSLVDDAAVLSRKVLITVQGKVRAALVSAEELEYLEETVSVLADSEAMEAIEQSKADVVAGNVSSWEDMKAELGL
ncbi:MAG: type II toxin-antitoxin system Phd/YefM family antitoxin [bacterium]|nr:type II toxin-antitoxin system Phd/YefM family antitoxin [bacterium]